MGFIEFKNIGGCYGNIVKKFKYRDVKRVLF